MTRRPRGYRMIPGVGASVELHDPSPVYAYVPTDVTMTVGGPVTSVVLLAGGASVGGTDEPPWTVPWTAEEGGFVLLQAVGYSGETEVAWDELLVDVELLPLGLTVDTGPSELLCWVTGSFTGTVTGGADEFLALAVYSDALCTAKIADITVTDGAWVWDWTPSGLERAITDLYFRASRGAETVTEHRAVTVTAQLSVLLPHAAHAYSLQDCTVDAGKVAAVSDLVGSDDLTQAVAGERLTYGASEVQFGGRAYARDGGVAGHALHLEGAQAMTAGVRTLVVQGIWVDVGNHATSVLLDSAADDCAVFMNDSTDGVLGLWSSTGGSTAATLISELAFVAIIRFDAAGTSRIDVVFADGTETSGAIATGTAPSASTLLAANAPGLINGWIGEFGELVVCDGDDDTPAVWADLRGKWCTQVLGWPLEAEPLTGSYYTTFLADEPTLCEGWRWYKHPANPWKKIRAVGGNALANAYTEAYDDAYSYLKAWGGSDDVEIVASVYNGAATPGEKELLFRVSDSSTEVRAYECLFRQNNHQVVRWNGPQGEPDGFTVAGTDPNFTITNYASLPASEANRQIRALIQGFTIRTFYRESPTAQWTHLATAVDADLVKRHAAGKPGLGLYVHAADGNLNSSGIAEWQVTDLSSLEGCIQDGTIQWLYDAEYGLTVVGGYVTVWAPKICIGGTAADELIPTTGQQPVYNAVDGAYGGRVTVERTTQGYLRSRTTTSAVTITQPVSIIDFCAKPPASPTGSLYFYDGARSPNRCGLRRVSGYWSPYSYNTYWSTGLAMGADTPLMTNMLYNGAGSTLKLRTNGGASDSRGPGTVGAASMQGLSLFGAYNATGLCAGKRTAIMAVKDLSAPDEARLLGWHQHVLGWI